jgi:enoyl-CoA hydratase/carnithine racemase
VTAEQPAMDRPVRLERDGAGGVFAAAADLGLLVDRGSEVVRELDLGQYWAPVHHCTKPVIAAVSGYVLGAGCELALMCDIIVATEDHHGGMRAFLDRRPPQLLGR